MSREYLSDLQERESRLLPCAQDTGDFAMGKIQTVNAISDMTGRRFI